MIQPNRVLEMILSPPITHTKVDPAIISFYSNHLFIRDYTWKNKDGSNAAEEWE